jgi:hypothetical protein
LPTNVEAVVVYPRRYAGNQRSFPLADVLTCLEESMALE